jgi:hypothetical protein
VTDTGDCTRSVESPLFPHVVLTRFPLSPPPPPPPMTEELMPSGTMEKLGDYCKLVFAEFVTGDTLLGDVL